MATHILAFDQGTTSTRAVVFGPAMDVKGASQQAITQFYPESGWVEHDALEILDSVISSSRQALRAARIDASEIAAIGITNQRETTVVWDRETGRPIGRAIVWQDRRTSEISARMRGDGYEDLVQSRTGLVIDPYFSATKIAWILDNTPGARKMADAGRLLFGTIDCFLVWHLTGGALHITDATNASRTMLYNFHTGCWDPDLLDIFAVPATILPRVTDCAGDFGTTRADLFGHAIPIRGIAGDQQAAMIGQACFKPGMVKATFGTGGFVMTNTGAEPISSPHRLLSTVAYQLDGKVTYALEGSMFAAGASVQWLRDSMKLIAAASDAGTLAGDADPTQTIYMVPAFVGLGAPHWDADARGAVYGITRNTGPAEFARAALESVAFQTLDLVEAMERDWRKADDTILRADGGMANSDWFMQSLADIVNAPVDRPRITETTVFGVAWLAGQSIGLWPKAEAFAHEWQSDRRFEPGMKTQERQRLISGWRAAVQRTLTTSASAA